MREEMGVINDEEFYISKKNKSSSSKLKNKPFHVRERES